MVSSYVSNGFYNSVYFYNKNLSFNVAMSVITTTVKNKWCNSR